MVELGEGDLAAVSACAGWGEGGEVDRANTGQPGLGEGLLNSLHIVCLATCTLTPGILCTEMGSCLPGRKL